MDIVGYPNYIIYEDGRVWGKVCKRFLKPHLNTAAGQGYKQIALVGDNGRKTLKIHRLIACHFIEHPGCGKNCVDHINRDKTDNRLENLRWVTHRENMNNKGDNISNTSGHKNICKHPSGWQFQKNVHTKTHTKYFKTLEEAIAYKESFLNGRLDAQNAGP